jgi:hypothetical protein
LYRNLPNFEIISAQSALLSTLAFGAHLNL